MQPEILEKVKKLLALGQSENEHEAALAVARAQALMEKHSISEAMLQLDGAEPEEEIQPWADPLFAGKVGSWRYRLGDVLAEANGVKVYKSGKSLKVIGRASDVQAVRYLFGFCLREIDRIAKARAAGNGRTWANNFRIGCVDAIREAIKKEREAQREQMRGAVADANALVKLDSAIAKIDSRHAQAWALGREKLRLRTFWSGSGRVDPSARAQGREAGRGIYPAGGVRRLGSGHRRIGG